MNSHDLVSVIIPVYNVEKYIEQTIISVTEQTYQNIEIIIIDDGSTDLTASIISNINSSAICYYYQENKGVAFARNFGIQKSNGRFIAFLDGDDLWDVTKIEEQIIQIKKTGMCACYCGYSEFDDNSKKGKSYPKYFPTGNILIDFLNKKTKTWTCTWLIKKDIINHHIRFEDGIHWAEDIEFFLKIITCNSICVVKKYLAKRRIREGALSDHYSELPETQLSEIDMWGRYINWLDKYQPNINVEPIYFIIFKRRIPALVINYSFKCIAIGRNLNVVSKKYNFKNHINNYDFYWSFQQIILLVKKIIIQSNQNYKFIFRIYLKYIRSNHV